MKTHSHSRPTALPGPEVVGEYGTVRRISLCRKAQ